MSGRILITIFLFILTAAQSHAQDSTKASHPGFMKRYWDSLIHGNVDRTHEKPFDVSFALTPSYSREGGIGFGVSATGLYRMDMRDSTMAPSNVTIRANASLKGFFSLIGNGVNNFTDGRTRLVYSAKFTRKVLDFWGISHGVCLVNPTSEYIRTQFRVDSDYNYRLGKCFYFGAVMSFNHTNASRILDLTYLEGQKTNYYLTRIGASFQIDTRDNPTNPQKGLYLLLRETAYPEFLGTADMTNWSTSFVLSGYQPIWKGALITGDLYAQFNSRNVPWILREELGGAMGRKIHRHQSGMCTGGTPAALDLQIRMRSLGRCRNSIPVS